MLNPLANFLCHAVVALALVAGTLFLVAYYINFVQW
jgi:hypothetical protein